METLKVQTQIRQNAEEVSSYLSDLSKWENKAKAKDNALIKKKAGNSVAAVKSSYPVEETPDEQRFQRRIFNENLPLSPATIVGDYVPPESHSTVPKAAKHISAIDGEAVQREKGNEEFKSGNFAAAIKSYTICLGLKSNNVVAFSNRASAYLKMKEYSKAEADCNSALCIDAGHIKSLIRRASARNSLGKHRAALMDLKRAEEIDGAAYIRAELTKTRELLRSAVGRCPYLEVACSWTENGDAVVAGPII